MLATTDTTARPGMLYDLQCNLAMGTVELAVRTVHRDTVIAFRSAVSLNMLVRAYADARDILMHEYSSLERQLTLALDLQDPV